MSNPLPVSAAENTLAYSTSWDPASLDGETPECERRTRSDADLCEMLKRTLSYIRANSKPGLTVDCMFLVVGDGFLGGETMTSVARRHGVTKAAVSKRIRTMREALHLPKPIHCKPDHVARNYARTNVRPVQL